MKISQMMDGILRSFEAFLFMFVGFVVISKVKAVLLF